MWQGNESIQGRSQHGNSETSNPGHATSVRSTKHALEHQLRARKAKVTPRLAAKHARILLLHNSVYTKANDRRVSVPGYLCRPVSQRTTRFQVSITNYHYPLSRLLALSTLVKTRPTDPMPRRIQQHLPYSRTHRKFGFPVFLCK